MFISHTWRGPDAELVDPLVASLRDRGYTAWYDKDKGLRPGDMVAYLTDAVLDAKNCIPIICKEYFAGYYTQFELDALLRLKDPKHVFPLWWKDVDTAYLDQLGPRGQAVLKTAGVSWAGCGEDIERVVDQLEAYMLAAEDIQVHGGARLHESEAQVLVALEAVLGEPIPPLDDPASTSECGFVRDGLHVVELRLHRTRGGSARSPFYLPASFFKLKHLQRLAAPLMDLPPKIKHLRELRVLDLHGGKLDTLPESLADLPRLEMLDITGNTLDAVADGTGLRFLTRWAREKGAYPGVVDGDAAVLFILQAKVAGLQEPIPRVYKIEITTFFGYTTASGRVTGIGLYMKLTSLPETIGQLTSLQELVLQSNQLSSLPGTIGNLANLKELWLGNNQLSSLPETIGQLKSLTKLELGFNKLTCLPDTIGNLESLTKLGLGFNKLTSLPDTIGNLVNLKELNLDFIYRPGDSGDIQAIKAWIEARPLSPGTIKAWIDGLKKKGCAVIQ